MGKKRLSDNEVHANSSLVKQYFRNSTDRILKHVTVFINGNEEISGDMYVSMCPSPYFQNYDDFIKSINIYFDEYFELDYSQISHQDKPLGLSVLQDANYNRFSIEQSELIIASLDGKTKIIIK